jgi:uncharacterized membrane protein YqjE
METQTGNFSQVADLAKRLGRRLLATGENRLELLVVEMQEARERLLQAIIVALAVAVFGLLAGIALTLAVVVLLWEHSPAVALLVMAGSYGLTAGILFRRFRRLQQDWQALPATMEQLRKDRECLEENLN